jgi:(p)ppGpp synthase/HD superfamily hydrolase
MTQITLDYSGTALVLRAVAFAIRAHATQKRLYTNEPYVAHTIAVATAVAARTDKPHVIAAAVLHDVLEDTPVTHDQLVAAFGPAVAALVLELTDVFTAVDYPHFNRKTRKMMEAVRLGGVSAEAQLIKAYDILDNVGSVQHHDPEFAEVYLPEKRAVVARLTKLEAPERASLAGFI